MGGASFARCEGVDMGVFPVFADESVVYVFLPGGFALLNPRLLTRSSLVELKVHTLRFPVLRTM